MKKSIVIQIPVQNPPPYSLFRSDGTNRSDRSGLTEIKTPEALLDLINEVRPFSAAEEQKILDNIKIKNFEETCPVNDETFEKAMG
jgi:hypothetical protein